MRMCLNVAHCAGYRETCLKLPEKIGKDIKCLTYNFEEGGFLLEVDSGLGPE